MRSKLVSGILCLILGTAILLPSVKRLVHMVHEHTEEVCDNPSALHIHQVEADCELLKFYPTLQFLTHLGTVKIPHEIAYLKIKTSVYNRLSHYAKLHFSLRAPPFTS